MRPLVILAQSRDLQGFLRIISVLDRESLLEVNRRLLKMQMEVLESLEKIK
jgi:hypothetical protein